MSTLIGSASTNLRLTDDRFSITVNGNEVFWVTDTTASFASTQYVDSRSINDLAPQTADYSAQGYKLVNIAPPVLDSDAVNKQYVDEARAISEAIANVIVPTSGLTANQTEITNGTTPLNMNDQPILNLADATSDFDALNRRTAD